MDTAILRIACLLVAVILFALAAFGVVTPRGNLLAAGLGFLAAALLLG